MDGPERKDRERRARWRQNANSATRPRMDQGVPIAPIRITNIVGWTTSIVSTVVPWLMDACVHFPPIQFINMEAAETDAFTVVVLRKALDAITAPIRNMKVKHASSPA